MTPNTHEPADHDEDEDDASGPSRSARKRASEGLRKLGVELIDLRGELFNGLPIPPLLREAVVEARRMTAFGARRRQEHLIGKLMRQLEPETVEAIREALRVSRGESARDTALLHSAERWRTDLLADDEKLSQWLAEYPATDGQRLRALIRQARKDAREDVSGDGVRRGRAYRDLFRLLRDTLTAKH